MASMQQIDEAVYFDARDRAGLPEVVDGIR